MSAGFGFLSRFEFLQDRASAVIAGMNPAVVHNLGKYHALKKAHYLSAIEETEGDYLEFGVFTGSSFCHSLRCCRKLRRFDPKLAETTFWGFDSFAGFGPLEKEDSHPFYTDQNFETTLSKVERRVRRCAKDQPFRLIPGLFAESLTGGAAPMGIERARLVFIDSDTHASAKLALTFCAPLLRQGSFIVLDDYFAWRGREDRGVRRAFREFLANSSVQCRHVFTYGMGGCVFVVSETADGAS